MNGNKNPIIAKKANHKETAEKVDSGNNTPI